SRRTLRANREVWRGVQSNIPPKRLFLHLREVLLRPRLGHAGQRDLLEGLVRQHARWLVRALAAFRLRLLWFRSLHRPLLLRRTRLPVYYVSGRRVRNTCHPSTPTVSKVTSPTRESSTAISAGASATGDSSSRPPGASRAAAAGSAAHTCVSS